MKALRCLDGFPRVMEPMGPHATILMIQISGVYVGRHFELGLRAGASSEVDFKAKAEAVVFERSDFVAAELIRIDE